MSITAPDDRLSTYNPVVPTTEFAAQFPVFDNDDLIVIHNGVERDDFAVTASYIEGISTNAKAVFAVGITGTVQVVGSRDPRRTNRFNNGGPLPIRDQNLALDTVEAEVQELRRDVDRAFKAPFGGTGGSVTDADPGDFLFMDEDGNIRGVDPPSGSGNMNTAAYDPTGVGGDAFKLENMHGGLSDAQLKAGSAVKNRTTETISPFDPTFGALGGGNNDQVAIQAAFDAGSTDKATVVLADALRSAGQLTVENDLHVKWANGAYTYFGGYSLTGSLIQNLDPNSGSADSIVSNVLLENPQLDGSLYPDPITLEVASSTNNTVTFTAAASSVDDAYTGLLIQDMTGANEGSLRIITEYNGATRTATLNIDWASNPSAATAIRVGWNDCLVGMAAGTSYFAVRGGHFRNLSADKMVPAATGGKGVNGEQGVTNLSVSDASFEDIYNPLFCQGVDGVYGNGQKKRAIVRWENIYAKNGGSLMTVAGINTAQGPDGDSDDSMVVANNVQYENFGHSPYRIVPSDQQKSGIINFLEAQNVSISDVRGRNDATYPAISPGYPADYPARVGYGLAGSIGAMIWGHGRNLKIDGFSHHGNVDNVIVIRRGRALGDDAGDPTFPGRPRNCFNWAFKNIEHQGVINEYVIRIDPTASLRVAASELTGEIEVAVNGSFVTGGLVDPNMATFTGIVLTIKDHNGGKTVIGTPAQIYAAGNTFASFKAVFNDLRGGFTQVIADDTVFEITPPVNAGFLNFHLNAGTSMSSGVAGRIFYSVSGTALCEGAGIGSNVVVATTDLTDGTGDGTDARLNISAIIASGKIKVKNRMGASRTWKFWFD